MKLIYSNSLRCCAAVTFILLASCVDDSYVPSNTVTPPSPPESVARVPQAEFHAHAKGGGGYDLYIRIDGTDSLVASNVAYYDEFSRASYASRGIPANAVGAGSFREMMDSEEDTQGTYAVVEGSEVVVYKGFYVPGAGSRVEWERVALR